MITNIDDNFGKLIQKLKRLNIYDNTIIIFTTDNGTSNGYKYDKKEKKWYGYNSGMRGTKTSEYDVISLPPWPEVDGTDFICPPSSELMVRNFTIKC